MECLSCNDGLRGSLPCNCEAGLNITINQQAARIAELESACKLENELKTAGSLRELKLMGEVGELRNQLADLRVDAARYRTLRSTLQTDGSFDIGEAYLKLKVVGAYPEDSDWDATIDALAAQSARGKP